MVMTYCKSSRCTPIANQIMGFSKPLIASVGGISKTEHILHLTNSSFESRIGKSWFFPKLKKMTKLGFFLAKWHVYF